ncbi:MAG TPA: MFS transporter [Candidatus Dormibacteraeota bacterium]|jgi:MFS family permease|nr:MFS transporter [Candidatus Dormibacteraeota bacterium]
MDRRLLLAARGLRSFGFGFSAVLIGVHLERRGLSPLLIGLTLGLGLAAASLTGLASAALAAVWGRRRILAATGVLMALTGIDLAFAHQALLLMAAGITGMLGAASVDLGPFASVEQAVLAETAQPSERNVAFGRYSLTGGLFNAAGGLAAALATSADAAAAFFIFYAAIGLATAVLALFMSAQVEAESAGRVFGRFRPLLGLAALFALDSLGGGFVANAVIAYWLHVRFGVGLSVLGPVFAVVAVLQAFSYEVSGRLANRIGLINTMVFTHLPSNILLLLVPLAPSLGWAIALLLARFALSQMDVPARQAYIVSIVPPSERAGAVAMTGAVRGVAQSFGPVLAGLAIGLAAFGVPFFAGGGLKVIYDLALFAGFRNRRASHERG